MQARWAGLGYNPGHMDLLPWLIMAVLFGACVGSFLNVVIYRLPAGQSLVRPGSHCPRCSHSLAWYDNVPVLGWLWLGGKCRYCKGPISGQYPLVEAFTALVFGGLFGIYYFTDVRPEMYGAGFFATWPVLVVHLVLVGGLIAATVIDARLYIIPLPIPWLITVVALVGLPASAAIGWLPAEVLAPPLAAQVAPVAEHAGVSGAIGGVLGLIIAMGLLQTGMLPRSFDEVAEELTDPAPADAPKPLDATQVQEEIFAYPHPRREVIKEMLFVGFPLLGVVLGMWWSLHWAGSGVGVAPPPLWVKVLGGVASGYLVGGGLVWLTRILGTLAFGKEAMGLGDVHLLAAIGAVLGPMDSVLVFFVAPFIGLTSVLLMTGASAIARGKVRVIPYGPFLAAAAILMMIFRQTLLGFLP